jgi:hypothetical protein
MPSRKRSNQVSRPIRSVCKRLLCISGIGGYCRCRESAVAGTIYHVRMADEGKNSVTITWADACGRIVDLEVPRSVAEKMQRGERVTWFSPNEPTRRPLAEAQRETDDRIAQHNAAVAQIDSEIDGLVTDFPALKSEPPYPPAASRSTKGGSYEEQ